MFDGMINVYKEQGYTSNDVVGCLRGILHQRRIGHTGTLDPDAEGVLPVCLGTGTKLCSLITDHDKVYEASMRLGMTTDTQDISGRVIARHTVEADEEAVRAALMNFVGGYAQIPPMYSAIKVKGQKLYEIARRGGEVERRPRRITIHELKVAGRDGEDFLLDVRCSKGTYVRTLCHDIGRALGCGGCMSSLRRTRAGAFRLEDAHTLDEVQKAADAGQPESLLLPVDTLFDEEKATITGKAEAILRVGGQPGIKLPEGRYRIYSDKGEFLALCKAEQGKLLTIKSFFEV